MQKTSKRELYQQINNTVLPMKWRLSKPPRIESTVGGAHTFDLYQKLDSIDIAFDC